jgi:GT2 family glycosyltransferase
VSPTDVSVVMPVHGNWPVVRRAVEAVRAHSAGAELIAVDDVSPDDTGDRVEAEEGVVAIRSRENVGFGAACNLGAARAGGRFICFLNSDAIVRAGWLEPLIRAAERHGVAAAVPMLLNEDGTIQEAGGAVGRDGSTYPLGRGANADDPTWSFAREVDYGSAACLLVRRAEFEAARGFDAVFAPAYYEDADLCLRLAERGLRTVFEPSSRVTHLGYASGSVERARLLVEQNRKTFVARWGERLAHRPIVAGARPWPHRELALRDAIALIRMLVLDDAGLTRRLLALWPWARIEQAPDDLDGWLEDRRFHYSAVVARRQPDEALRAALTRSQPQAPLVVLGEAGDDQVIEGLAGHGIAPPEATPRG